MEVCNKDCFNCIYNDCIYDGNDFSDIDTRKLDLSISEQRAIENGTHSVWKYNHSESGRDARKRYRKSEKGKATERRKREKRIKSGKNAEYCRRYYYRKKAEQELKKMESEGCK